MDTALVVGGTRFIGRHVVDDLLDHGYEVSIFTRGNRENPFGDDVRHVTGNRTDRTDLRAAATASDPDLVIDCVAYHPDEVTTATDAFADADAYVYVSSGAAYAAEEIPKREGETALCDCTPEQADSDARETYGPRKAEGDRRVFDAAESGVRAMSVRPTVVYGPYDYTERLDYWLHRVDEYDRVIVPGDGDALWHLGYVEDVAEALRIVGESGDAGEAYNVGDRRLRTLAGVVEDAAAAMDADVELVTACAHELAAGRLTRTDFPLFRPSPHVLDTEKLASLGWESTPHGTAMRRTAAEHRGSDRDGVDEGPPRTDEERVLGVLDTL